MTFIARKSDSRLKTKITLGRRDLILKTKLNDQTDWELEENLEVFGEISKVDITIKWPTVDVKEITSPTKGRNRKKVHMISSESEDSKSPEAKKSKGSV